MKRILSKRAPLQLCIDAQDYYTANHKINTSIMKAANLPMPYILKIASATVYQARTSGTEIILMRYKETCRKFPAFLLENWSNLKE
jgi:hypothetical protein